MLSKPNRQNHEEKSPKKKQSGSQRSIINLCMSCSYNFSTPQGKNYPYHVNKKINEVYEYFKKKRFPAAIQALTQLNQHLHEKEYYEEWRNVSLYLKNKTLVEQFFKLIEEGRQKFQIQSKQNREFIFNKVDDVEETKTVLIKSLLNNDLDSAIQLCAKIKDSSQMVSLLKQVQEYRWLRRRHDAFQKIIFREYGGWNDKDIPFCKQREGLKLFIDEAYEANKSLDIQLNIVAQDYFRNKNISSSSELMNSLNLKKEVVKWIFKNHIDEYEYAQLFIECQKYLIQEQILDNDYYKDENDRWVLLRQQIYKIINFYKERRNSKPILIEDENGDIMTVRQPLKMSKISASTDNRSSIILQGLQLNEKQAETISYSNFTVKELYEGNKQLKLRLSQLEDQLEDTQNIQNQNIQLSDLVKRLQIQVQKNKQKISDLQKEKKSQILQYQRKIKGLLQQLQKIQNLYKTEKNAFDSFREQMDRSDSELDLTISVSENSLSFDKDVGISKILIQNDRKQLLDILKGQIRYSRLDYFQKIYSTDVQNDLAKSIIGKDNLLMIIKLTKSQKIISIYVEKGIYSANHINNRSEILSQKRSSSQVSNSQSDILNSPPSNILSAITPPIQEYLNDLENGFIYTHWNANRFHPSKKIKLIKLSDQNPLVIEVGHKDLQINLKKMIVKSYIGKRQRQESVFALKQSNGWRYNNNLLDGAKTKASFDKFEIYQINFTHLINQI